LPHLSPPPPPPLLLLLLLLLLVNCSFIQAVEAEAERLVVKAEFGRRNKERAAAAVAAAEEAEAEAARQAEATKGWGSMGQGPLWFVPDKVRSAARVRWRLSQPGRAGGG
jgi:hypothetical protein